MSQKKNKHENSPVCSRYECILTLYYFLLLQRILQEKQEAMLCNYDPLISHHTQHLLHQLHCILNIILEMVPKQKPRYTHPHTSLPALYPCTLVLKEGKQAWLPGLEGNCGVLRQLPSQDSAEEPRLLHMPRYTLGTQHKPNLNFPVPRHPFASVNTWWRQIHSQQLSVPS